MQFAVDAARDRTVGPTLDAGDQAIDGRASATDATTSPPRVDAGTPIAILFGGALNDPAAPLTDTWEWDGTAWTQLDVTGPPAGAGTGLAPFHGDLVLIDGVGATWTWDGAAWTQVTAAGPPPRAGAVMAPIGDTLVLYGGGTYPPLADTWTWDGTAWTQLDVTGPPARDNAAMAPLDGKLVLFGGYNAASFTYLADTWTWDGTAWSQLDATGPRARENAVMAPLGGKLYLLGGDSYGDNDAGEYVGGTFFSDTWTWDGTTWTQLEIAGPSLWESAIAPLGSRLLVFGGLLFDGGTSVGNTGDTWISDGGSWKLVPVAGPSARESAVMGSLIAQ